MHTQPWPLLPCTCNPSISLCAHLPLPACPPPCLPARLQVYNHVASGFTDANPYLRELTLKSMAVLGPKLSQKTLSQSLLKHLAKLQVGEAGGWRLEF